ncbi:ribosome hibernation-promoting factor, HPF/YfiA family [Muricoccus radiodurans]|uniref:ribosome hibernation-promoting factor, HPF/YfiA family n=1 Tax=Muricoccus radiodurans TaxID=2231721 RepID=UPI003CEE18F1
MQITVAGKGVDTGDALKAHVTEGLETVARKYFDHAIDARVTFRKDGAFFACDINLHAGRNVTVQGEGEGPDAHRAFNAAAEHVGKQLRRHRRRVNDHSRGQAGERDALVDPASDATPIGAGLDSELPNPAPT